VAVALLAVAAGLGAGGAAAQRSQASAAFAGCPSATRQTSCLQGGAADFLLGRAKPLVRTFARTFPLLPPAVGRAAFRAKTGTNHKRPH